jgi:hypothetical protein
VCVCVCVCACACPCVQVALCESCGARHYAHMCCCGAPADVVPSQMELGKFHGLCGRWRSGHRCMYNADVALPLPSTDRIPYSFYAEWTLRMRGMSPRNTHDSHICSGVDLGICYPLCGVAGFGIARVESIDVGMLHEVGFPTLQRLLRGCVDKVEENDLLKRLKVPAVIGQRDRVCSPFCTITSANRVCNACYTATTQIDNRWVAQLATRLECVQMGAASRACPPAVKNAIGFVPNSKLTDVERLAKLDMLAGEKRATSHMLLRRSQQLIHANRVVEELRALADQPLTTVSLSSFVERLKRANEEGQLKEDSSAAIKLVEKIICNMVSGKARNSFDMDTKHFYGVLLLHGGPRIHNFVASALLGPSLETTRRFLREHKTGEVYDWGKGLFHTAADILFAMGLKEAPCIVVEDGTALTGRYDVVAYKDKVVLFGASSGPLVFRTLQDVEDFHAKDPPNVATQFYLYMLVPLVKGAPAIPIAVKLQDGTTGTYNAKVVVEAWRDGWEALLEKGVKIVGHSGDGASAIRSAMLHHMHRDVPEPGVGKAATFPHALVRIVVPYLNKKFPILMFPDYLHIIFRLRRIFLDPKHFLVVFGMPCCPTKIVTWELEKSAKESLGIRSNDLNANDKQHFAGCMRLFDIKIKHGNWRGVCS